MKKIIIMFGLACVCLVTQAQTPPPAYDPAKVDALTRAAERALARGDTNTAQALAAQNNLGTVPVVNSPSPALPFLATNPAPATPLAPLAPVVAPTHTNTAPSFPEFPAIRPRHSANTNVPVGLTPPSTIPAPAMLPPTAQAALNAALPPPPAPEPADVELNFPGTAIDAVLEFYATVVNRTILRGSALGQITINLHTTTPLTKTEAIQALDTVLAMNGITMLNVGDKFVKAVPVATAAQQGVPFNQQDPSKLPEADQYVTQIVQLKYTKTSEVMPAIQPLAQIPNSIIPLENNGVLVIRDYASNVKRIMEMIKQVDVTIPLDIETAVIPIKYAKAEDIASALNSLSGGGGGGTSIGHSASSGLGSRNPAGVGGLGGTSGLGGTGYPGTAGSLASPTTPGMAGGFGGGAGGNRTTSFSDRVNSIIKGAAAGSGGQGQFQILGQTKIIADDRTNSLLVFASKQDMEMISNIVSKLDIVLAQVLIEAIIMEVTLDNSRSLGVSYLQNNASQGGNYFTGIGGLNNGTFLNPGSFVNTGTNIVSALPSGLSYYANFGNDFNATLTAIASDSRINVLSRPRIQTSHGVPASLEVGETVPEVTGTYFGGVNGQASSQYQQTFVGINLTVTPLINPDGLVVMDIMQDVEQLGPSTTIDGNPVPTTTKRTAQAEVSVRDRDTIILGGMISSSKSTSNSGLPFLKDIPLLGYLFRSSNNSGERVELVVLIHPTVLPTPEAAALVADHERARLPGVKTAEAEERADEARRIKSAEKVKLPKED